MTAPAVLELPLDDALLKVLSSESRREIMRLLAERRMTGAELATRLDLGKPAVSEHLKKLLEAGLIDRLDDPERRWVYYSLSARGRSILEPQRVRFYLVLAVAALALMLGMALALGLVAFLEKGQGDAAGTGADAGAGQGSGLAGLPGATDPTALLTSTTTKAPAPPPPAEPAKQEMLVYTGPTRAAKAAANGTGNATPDAPVTQSFTLLLKDGRPLPMDFLRQGGVVVLRPQDIDPANGTALVEVVALANGTVPQGLDNATAIVAGSSAPVLLPVLPGASPTLQVMAAEPLATEVPAVQAPDANTTSPATTTASETAPTMSTATTASSSTASTTATMTTTTGAAASTPTATTTQAAKDTTATATTPPLSLTVPTTTRAPTAAPTVAATPTAGLTGAAAQPAQTQGADPASGNEVPATVREPRDAMPLPLLAILAAAVLAGILRPLRKD